MNKDQWEEIKIEDVQPGDVARCNGREFPVVHWFGEAPWVVKVGRFTAGPEWGFFKILGFTFHRKVKREPRTVDCISTTIDSFGRPTRVAILPYEWPINMPLRVTEILDGEDGA
jgi:hypothetical protein